MVSMRGEVLSVNRQLWNCCLLCVLTTLCVLVTRESSSGTPITTGEVSLDFVSPPTPHAPWELFIRACHLTPSEYAQVVLTVPSEIGPGNREEILWEGPVTPGDSIIRTLSIPPPPPGRYVVAASYVARPGGPMGDLSTTKVAYVLVRTDTVFVAWSSNWENLRNEILYELRKRGLGGVSEEEMKTLAPDLAQRWHELYYPKGITTIRTGQPVKVDTNDRVGSLPGRDTIAIPGSGPPERRPPSDSMRDSVSREKDTLREWRPRTSSSRVRTPGDSEFGRSEEARKIREEIRHFMDTTSIKYDSGAVGGDNPEGP
jgi:hypothetical protein